MCCIAIGRMLADFLHELGDNLGSNTIDAVIVVAKLRRRIFALVFIVDNQTGVVANDMNFAVLYCRKTIGNDR
jgi:hypothetical protein